MRTRLLTLVLGVLGAALVPSALADGLPVEGVDASLTGVPGISPGEPRYVTLPAEKGTVVAAVDQASGQVLRSRFVPGRFTVPVVAYDGTASGLSADGSTLVLIRPRVRFPRRVTTFAVLGTERLRVREELTFRRDFSFDALSPDGRWLYLVEYLSRRDPTRYLVRLYDIERGRLLPEPIIDPREVGNVMRGMPVTRASSPDGRFAYTLYDGAGKHPFVHALDTVERTARCIDLHGLMGYEFLPELLLDISPDGGTLAVVNPSEPEPLFLIDTTTDDVTEPAEPPAPESAAPPQPAAAPKDEPRSLPWPLIAGGSLALLLLLLAGARLVRRRHRGTEPDPFDLLFERVPDVDAEAREAERPRVPVP
jgi:hypothetical protein